MIQSSGRTITQVFLDSKTKPSTQIAFRYSDGAKWNDIAWPEYFSMSQSVAAGLAAHDVKRGDRVAIMSNTRFQWAVTDLAVLGMGSVTVPIYQNNTNEDVEFIINNSQAAAVFVEDSGQLQKLQDLQGKIPSVKYVISFTKLKSKDQGDKFKVLQWDELVEEGKKYLISKPDFFERECKKNQFSDMATIVYTSGTTGQPKGVVLLHSCIASECEELRTLLDLNERDSTLTFLPFAHIFGRVEMWCNVYIGWKMAFAESIDKIADNLLVIRPTFMMAVPRIFEKIYSKIMSQVDDGSDAKKKIFRWAVSVGAKVSEAKRNKENIPLPLLLQYKAAYKLVFEKINAKLGGNLKFLISGGAPLSQEIEEFFHAADILILEGYGLTETTAAVTINTPYKYRFGSVGIGVGDVKLKIAEDGEILVRSAKVFREYFLNPDATTEALTEGWFHTGDIGEIDTQGFLKITDRKKDLIKTAGGKMIAPQKLENALKTNKFISQVVIFGDKMKYLVALITLNYEELRKFAKDNGLEEINPVDLVKDPKVHELVREIIREKNSTLASYETIKNFTILPGDFSIESGELTPSLKIKRKYLCNKYDGVIQELYHGH